MKENNDVEIMRISKDIRKATLKVLERAIIRNAMIMSHDDETLLVSIAHKYTEFYHSDKITW